MKCDVCECQLEGSELPFFCDGAAYCSQCFVWLIAPEQPARFQAHVLRAIKCTRCRSVSVDCGLDLCGQCGYKVVSTLPAK